MEFYSFLDSCLRRNNTFWTAAFAAVTPIPQLYFAPPSSPRAEATCPACVSSSPGLFPRKRESRVFFMDIYIFNWIVSFRGDDSSGLSIRLKCYLDSCFRRHDPLGAWECTFAICFSNRLNFSDFLWAHRVSC